MEVTKNPKYKELLSAERMRKLKEVSLQEVTALMQEEPTPSSSSTVPTLSFKHKTTKSRSLNKAIHCLPKSPHKRNEVIQSLMSKFELNVAVQPPWKKG